VKKQTKILHAITRLDKGGSATNTLLSAIGLVKKGYAVDLLYGCTREADEELIIRAKKAGVRVFGQNTLVRNIHPVKDLIAFFKIFGFILEGNYDIVHAHSHKAGLVCRWAAKCAGVKKIVYTPHGHVFYGYFGGALTGLILLAERITVNISDKTVGLTESECREWVLYGIGKREKYTAIPSGIEFSSLELETSSGTSWREELDIPENAILIGSAGRLIKIKGYKYFIEAAIQQIKKRDNVYFVIAGDGPLEGDHRRLIASAGVEDRFFIVPWQKNVGTLIKSLDIFVLSSLNEGMGRVLVEAMFFGVPVIGTHVSGIPSVIADGAGILIEPASPEGISVAIDAMLDNRAVMHQMGQRGRAKALAEYSADRMINLLDELYKELLESE